MIDAYLKVSKQCNYLARDTEILTTPKLFPPVQETALSARSVYKKGKDNTGRDSILMSPVSLSTGYISKANISVVRLRNSKSKQDKDKYTSTFPQSTLFGWEAFRHGINTGFKRVTLDGFN